MRTIVQKSQIHMRIMETVYSRPDFFFECKNLSADVFSHMDLGIVDLRDDGCNSSGVIVTIEDGPAEESSINL